MVSIALLGVKEREHARARPQHAMQRFDHGLQQRRRQKLQRVPHQRAVELLVGKIQRGVQKLLGLQRIGLVFVKIAVAETLDPVDARNRRNTADGRSWSGN